MSKALEELEKAKNRNGLPLNQRFAPVTEKEIAIIEQELKDKADQDRALKLIIEKGVDMELFKKCGNAVSYNSNVYASQTLKIDDYVFLKEFVSKYGAGGD